MNLVPAAEGQVGLNVLAWYVAQFGTAAKYTQGMSEQLEIGGG